MHSRACLTIALTAFFIAPTIADNGILAEVIKRRDPCQHKKNMYSLPCKPPCPSGWTGNGCSTPVCPGGCGLYGKCILPGYCKCDGYFSFQTCDKMVNTKEVLYDKYFFYALTASAGGIMVLFMFVVLVFCQRKCVTLSDKAAEVVIHKV